jgi:hypothetical protein
MRKGLSLVEAMGAGPIMLGDLAEDLKKSLTEFNSAASVISRHFRDPNLDRKITSIRNDLTILERKIRRGDILMRVDSEEYATFTRTVYALNDVLGTVMEREPNMIIFQEIISRILLQLQSIANAVTSRIGVQTTKAAGVVDIAMFTDLLMLLVELSKMIENRSDVVAFPGFGPNFEIVAKELYEKISEGITVDAVDMELRKIYQMVSTVNPMDPYEKGLITGIFSAIIGIVSDLGLDNPPPMGGLPPVRAKISDDDYNE